MSPAEYRAAVLAAWAGPRLRYKLHPHQKRAYDDVRAMVEGKRKKRRLWRWSRRLGKTTTSEVHAVEGCILTPGGRYVVAAPSGEHLERFVKPAIEMITADAPPDLKPAWNSRLSEYKFPEYGAARGSIISLYGCDTDRKISLMGRGPAANGIIFEEAGEIPDLKKARAVTAPQLLSLRHAPFSGWMLFVGTPPESAAHYYAVLSRLYRQDGRELHYTIYDGHYTSKEIEQFIEDEADGQPISEYKESEEFRREFMAEIISDPSRKVLKFATEPRLRECVERYRNLGPRPSHFVVYEGMDVGWSPDWTFWLIGWWHHAKQTLVIERELFYRNGFQPDTLAQDVKDAEAKLLGASRRAPYRKQVLEPRRWSDYSPFLLQDLASKHDLVFATTAKDDRDTAISDCDRMIPGYGKAGQLAINPDGCPMLLQQMEAAIWNKARTEFDKGASRAMGHYDGVAALVYLTRNVVKQENPFPVNYELPSGVHSFVIPGDTAQPKTEAEKWASMYDMGGAD